MLIIPLEGSANDHQNANAKAYTKKGSVIVEEKNLPESLEKTLEANTHYTKPQNQKISTLGAEKVFKSILG